MALDSDTLQMMLDSADRLLGEQCQPETVNSAEKGEWPAGLWQEIEAAGLTVVAVPEEQGGAGGAISDMAAVQRLFGYYAVPAPAAETALARHLCSAAGLEPPEGPLTLALDPAGLRASSDGKKITGRVRHVPWAAKSVGIVAVARAEKGPAIALLSPQSAKIGAGANAAGDARDDVAFQDSVAMAAAAAPGSVDRIWALAALMRVQQMAGAGQRALDICTLYARERKQFGRPIGNFQAVQQLLAELAGYVAAVNSAAESAALAADAPDAGFAIAAAKTRAGENAGRIGAIAHQVLGAMGFTYEHNLHHFTRRLWSWRDEFGSDTSWAMEVGRHMLALGPEGLWPALTAGA